MQVAEDHGGLSLFPTHLGLSVSFSYYTAIPIATPLCLHVTPTNVYGKHFMF